MPEHVSLIYLIYDLHRVQLAHTVSCVLATGVALSLCILAAKCCGVQPRDRRVQR